MGFSHSVVANSTSSLVPLYYTAIHKSVYGHRVLRQDMLPVGILDPNTQRKIEPMLKMTTLYLKVLSPLLIELCNDYAVD